MEPFDMFAQTLHVEVVATFVLDTTGLAKGHLFASLKMKYTEIMLYKSTRNSADKKTFSDVLLTGLAPDGGLYVPDIYPSIDDQTLDAWQSLSYPDLAFEVAKLFVVRIFPKPN